MIIVPFINPLRYKEKGYLSDYQTRYFDEHLFPETILDFEEHVDYYQPWQTGDQINQQLFSDADSMSISFYDEDDDSLILTQAATFVSSTTLNGTTYNCFHIFTDTSDIGNGRVYAIVSAGGLQIESHRMEICSNQRGTVLARYSNPKFYEDVIWEFLNAADVQMYFRINGYIKHNLPERVSSTYEDQPLNMTALKNTAFNSYSFITDSAGIPTYMIDICNRVMGCKNLAWDNRAFTVPESNKWEEKEEERYPMRGWGIDMRESVNKKSKSFPVSVFGFELLEDGGFALLEDDGLSILEG